MALGLSSSFLYGGAGFELGATGAAGKIPVPAITLPKEITIDAWFAMQTNNVGSSGASTFLEFRNAGNENLLFVVFNPDSTSHQGILSVQQQRATTNLRQERFVPYGDLNQTSYKASQCWPWRHFMLTTEIGQLTGSGERIQVYFDGRLMQQTFVQASTVGSGAFPTDLTLSAGLGSICGALAGTDQFAGFLNSFRIFAGRLTATDAMNFAMRRNEHGRDSQLLYDLDCGLAQSDKNTGYDRVGKVVVTGTRTKFWPTPEPNAMFPFGGPNWQNNFRHGFAINRIRRLRRRVFSN